MDVRKQYGQLTADTVRKVENTQSAKMNVFYKNNEKYKDVRIEAGNSKLGHFKGRE